MDRVVRGTVEETLNTLLESEADRLCNAQRYERTEARRDRSAGHYERSLETKAGEATLRMPRGFPDILATSVNDHREDSDRLIIGTCRFPSF